MRYEYFHESALAVFPQEGNKSNPLNWCRPQKERPMQPDMRKTGYSIETPPALAFAGIMFLEDEIVGSNLFKIMNHVSACTRFFLLNRRIAVMTTPRVQIKPATINAVLIPKIKASSLPGI